MDTWRHNLETLANKLRNSIDVLCATGSYSVLILYYKFVQTNRITNTDDLLSVVLSCCHLTLLLSVNFACLRAPLSCIYTNTVADRTSLLFIVVDFRTLIHCSAGDRVCLSLVSVVRTRVGVCARAISVSDWKDF